MELLVSFTILISFFAFIGFSISLLIKAIKQKQKDDAALSIEQKEIRDIKTLLFLLFFK